MSNRKQHGSPKRVSDAISSELEVRAFCKREGLSLRVMNDGHHWVATDSKQFRVEWWPSTAKAVRGNSPERFHHKLRVATVDQFMELVEQELEAVVVAPGVVRMRPDEKPVYPQQPTQTAAPTDWNTCNGEPQPTLLGIPIHFGMVPTGRVPDEPTKATKGERTVQYVQVEAGRYEELIVCEIMHKQLVRFLNKAAVVFVLGLVLGVVLFFLNR